MWRHRYPFYGRHHFYGRGHFNGNGHFMGPYQYHLEPSVQPLITGLWVALLLVLVCAFLLWSSRKKVAVSGYGYRPAPLPHQPNALEILRQRYALGEIDDVTFENMRERLEALDARERPPND